MRWPPSTLVAALVVLFRASPFVGRASSSPRASGWAIITVPSAKCLLACLCAAPSACRLSRRSGRHTQANVGFTDAATTSCSSLCQQPEETHRCSGRRKRPRFHPRHRHGRRPPRLSLLAVCRCTHRQSGSPRAFQCCCSRHHPTPGHSGGVRWTREARGVKPRAFIVLRGRSCSPARRGAAVRELADDRGDIQAMRAWGSERRKGVN